IENADNCKCPDKFDLKDLVGLLTNPNHTNQRLDLKERNPASSHIGFRSRQSLIAT
uniref:Uncharacterized protein n=1 Tax=Meloidogyne javanica TaxID=6303 RepID=A0A915LTY6_MELJA